MKDKILTEAKRLYDLGFAVLWLREREKRPVKSGWTTGERETWDELRRSYRAGFNVGVRLGRPSRVDGGYLACLDLDVKEPKYRETALRALSKVVQGRVLPEVRSGGGNGSRHLYFVTPEPFKMITIGKEKGAWELVAYSDGRQMALPPSIHPSGRSYVWKNQIGKKFVVLDAEEIGKTAVLGKRKTLENGAPSHLEKNAGNRETSLRLDENLDVRWDPRIAEATRALIVKGTWRGNKGKVNRSDYLPLASSSLLKSGLSQNEVLSILTDSSTYLGKCAYDHAATRNRVKAAKWLYRFTTARVKGDMEGKFSEPIEPEIKMEPWEEAIQNQELEGEKSWTQGLQKTENGICKNTLNNVYLILKNTFPQPLFRFNEFAKLDELWQKPEWATAGERGQEFQERDVQKIKLWLSEKFKFQATDDNIWSAIVNLSDENAYHPIREYLENLPPWDGKMRVDFFLERYLRGQAPKKYIRAVSRKTIVAMIARVFEPGVKFDTMLVLEGAQGLRKSTAIAALASRAWFSDANLNLKNKDSISDMAGKWVMEQGEMNVLNKHDVAELKQFLSRSTDRMRPSYGRKSQDYPRQSIFIGTTNEDIYLKDTTGSRRFWPVKVTGECDIDSIIKDRDQIFAEALAIYRKGEPIWIPDTETAHLARAQQSEREISDELIEVIKNWIDKMTLEALNSEESDFDPSCLKMSSFWDAEGPFSNNSYNLKMDHSGQMRVGSCLRVLGYQSKPVYVSGATMRRWLKITASKELDVI